MVRTCAAASERPAATQPFFLPLRCFALPCLPESAAGISSASDDSSALALALAFPLAFALAFGASSSEDSPSEDDSWALAFPLALPFAFALALGSSSDDSSDSAAAGAGFCAALPAFTMTPSDHSPAIFVLLAFVPF